MFSRYLEMSVQAAVKDTPVLLIHGPRQTGKSTLARSLKLGKYLTLDDATLLDAVSNDPEGFIRSVDGTLVLDEVQRAPQLFRSIKASVDRDRQPGRFILTGSANIMLLPKLSESLAGRMEILTLWPLSQGEFRNTREVFIDVAFGLTQTTFHSVKSKRGALDDAMLRGGYPEAAARDDENRRRAWFGSYLTTVLQRDLRDITNIDRLTAMPRMASMLAARTATLVNVSEISRTLGLPMNTMRRYIDLLEAVFLVQPLPAWSTNLGKRLVRAPKLYLCDTGLTAYLCNMDSSRLASEREFRGRLLESFVFMELRKQAEWSRARPSLFHFRSHDGHEVDFIMEGPAGDIVGVEVKASGTVTASDFKGLRYLRDALGKRFVRGIVLYTGTNPVPCGNRLEVLPVECLWQGER